MNSSQLRAEFLDEVKQAVCKERTKSHGQPEDNFKNIAWLWTGWLRGRHRLDVSLDVLDVGYMSILLKVARAESNPRHLDHATDSAGYAACIGGELKNEEMREKSPMGKLAPKQVDVLLHAGDSVIDRWSNLSDRLNDELREMREKSPVSKPISVSEKVPEPKPEFKATHIADNLDLVRLVSTDGDSVKYETQDGCLATVSREYFFSVFRPLSEKVPKVHLALPYQRKRDKAKVRVLFREGDKVTYHFEDQAVPKALEMDALEFDAEFEPVPESEPWKPTHKCIYGSGYFVRVLKSTSDEVQYETEQRIPRSMTHRDFAGLFIPVSE